MVRLLLLMMIGSVSVHGTSYCMSAVRGPPLSLGSWFPGSSLSFSPKEEGVGGREAGATPTAPSFQTGALGPTSSVPSVPVGVRAPSSGPPSPGSQHPPRSRHGQGRERTSHGHVGLVMDAEHWPAIGWPVGQRMLYFRSSVSIFAPSCCMESGAPPALYRRKCTALHALCCPPCCAWSLHLRPHAICGRVRSHVDA